MMGADWRLALDIEEMARETEERFRSSLSEGLRRDLDEVIEERRIFQRGLHEMFCHGTRKECLDAATIVAKLAPRVATMFQWEMELRRHHAMHNIPQRVILRKP